MAVDFQAQRRLAVYAEMDASKYVAGAKAVEGSSASAGKAVGGLGATVQQTDQKISQSGDILARLSRQYVDGYAAAQRMQSAVNSLSRGIDSGKISMAQAEPILEGIYRKYGQLGSGASFAAKGQAELAAAIDRTTARMQAQNAVAARMPAGANDNEATFRRRNLNYQLFDASQGLALSMNPAMIAMQQGPQILQMYAGQGGVNAALKDAGSLAATLVTRLGPIAAVAGLGALAISNMRDELEKTEGRAVTFGETFKAAMQVIAWDIGNLVKPAIDVIAPGFKTAFDAVTAGALLAGNTIINSFRAAYVDLEYVWEQFPNMIGTVVITGLNTVVGGVEDMLNSVTSAIDSWIEAINSRLNSIIGPGTKFQTIGRIDFGPDLPNPYGDALRRGTDERNRRVRDIMGSNPLGDYYRSVRDRVGAGMTNPAAAGDQWAGLRESDRQRLEEMRKAAQVIEDAFKGIERVGMSAIDRIVDSATNGFRDIGDVMKSVANDIMKELLELAVKNPLKNFLYGSGLPTLDTVGGGMGFLGTLFGARPRNGASGPAAPAPGMAWPSNDNYAPGAVTRMPLPPVGTTAANQNLGIEAYIRQAAQLRGIDPNIAVRVAMSEGGLKDPFRQGEAMLSYGREESFGPFQLHMRQGGVGVRALKAGIDPRTNWQGGVDYALDEAANKGWGQWFGAAKVGIGNREGLENARALGEFTRATQEATQNLNGFDAGIGKVAQSLLGGTGAGASSGGLGGLFGLGLSNFGKGFNPTRTGFMDMLGGGAGASGGGGFLGWLMSLFGFASGGYTGPGGVNDPRGIVHAGEVVFSQADVRRNGGVAAVEAMRTGAANQNARPVNFTSTVINNSSAQIQESSEDDGEGGRRIVYTISDQVVSAMNKPGTSLNREMRNRGAAPRRKSRS